MSLAWQPPAASEDGILSLFLPRFWCDSGQIASLVIVGEKSCRSLARVPGLEHVQLLELVLWISNVDLPWEKPETAQFFHSKLGPYILALLQFLFLIQKLQGFLLL